MRNEVPIVAYDKCVVLRRFLSYDSRERRRTTVASTQTQLFIAFLDGCVIGLELTYCYIWSYTNLTLCLQSVTSIVLHVTRLTHFLDFGFINFCLQQLVYPWFAMLNIILFTTNWLSLICQFKHNFVYNKLSIFDLQNHNFVYNKLCTLISKLTFYVFFLWPAPAKK